MSFSTLPLSYCTNLHPGQTVAEVLAGLRQFTVPTRERFGPLAAGLWLARPVVTELLQDVGLLMSFRDELRESRLSCYTLNTFPFGNFHAQRVKENVYLPDWSTQERFDYTADCAVVLAMIMDDEIIEGSLSTVPLGFKPFQQPAGFLEDCAERLIDLAELLDHLFEVTGKRIRLAIEPEPYCVLETTAETTQFFDLLRRRAADREASDEVNEYLGVCYDVCHQAVEFEDVAASILDLDRAGIRINKVHITCAIRIDQPATNIAARQALARFAEPRYLHQTFARNAAGKIICEVDLTPELALTPPPEFSAASEWRIHFHVPVNAESVGPLGTTRDDLRRALATVKTLCYSPHLEVETYTWDVLPDGRRMDLIDGLTAELLATQALLKL